MPRPKADPLLKYRLPPPSIPTTPTFPQFTRLPPELRLKVWYEYLDAWTPRLLRFTIRAGAFDTLTAEELWMGREVFLEPRCVWPEPKPRFSNRLHTLVTATAAYRAAAATCVESRQVALASFPDALPFRVLPVPMSRRYKRPDGPRPRLAEYTLRFNGARDIVLCYTSGYARRSLKGILELPSNRPVADALARMRHIGIPADDFEEFYDTVWRSCMCNTGQCNDMCKHDCLPRFLTSFPSLETLYLAHGMSTDAYDKSCRKVLPRDVPPPSAAGCLCEQKGPSNQLKHPWQTVWPTDLPGFCFMYDERVECVIPELVRNDCIDDLDFLSRLRERRPHAPYYQALSHLKILFLMYEKPQPKPRSRKS